MYKGQRRFHSSCLFELPIDTIITQKRLNTKIAYVQPLQTDVVQKMKKSERKYTLENLL